MLGDEGRICQESSASWRADPAADEENRCFPVLLGVTDPGDGRSGISSGAVLNGLQQGEDWKPWSGASRSLEETERGEK